MFSGKLKKDNFCYYLILEKLSGVQHTNVFNVIEFIVSQEIITELY